eukprot:13825621-Heterocapsa_arctica.AAC.1
MQPASRAPTDRAVSYGLGGAVHLARSQVCSIQFTCSPCRGGAVVGVVAGASSGGVGGAVLGHMEQYFCILLHSGVAPRCGLAELLFCFMISYNLWQHLDEHFAAPRPCRWRSNAWAWPRRRRSPPVGWRRPGANPQGARICSSATLGSSM